MIHETVVPIMTETSVEELACSVLTDSLTSVRHWLKKAAREWADDDEIVHQLRVFSRRALSALNLFKVLLPESEVRWFRKKVKAVLQAAGRARDLDVLMTIQLRRCGNARKILAKQWRAERAAAQQPLVKLCRKLQHHDRFRKHVQLLVRKLKTVAADGEHDIRLVCDERILPQFAGLCRTVVDALEHEADVLSLHELRIAVKRLRYAATQLLPVFKSQKQPEMVKILEELQTQLGVMHDHVVAKQELKRSLARLKKQTHQRILRKLIESETRSIADSVATFRAWLTSDACRELKQCIQSIV